MTQQILFFTAILIGAFYAVKYGHKAKANIEKFQKDKEDKKITDESDNIQPK